MGNLFFAAPQLLLGLAALPALWWLLRSLPPPPKQIAFPAVQLIRRSETTVVQARPPWWLVLLRLLLAACLILAASAPTWLTSKTAGASGDLILVVDTGWESATALPEAARLSRTALANRVTTKARIAILGTAPPPGGWPATPQLTWLSPDMAQAALKSVSAQPWPADRDGFLKNYARLIAASRADILWLSNGIDPASANRFAATLGQKNITAARLSESGPLAFRNVASRPEGFAIDLISTPAPLARRVQLIARTTEGRIAGSTNAILAPGAASTALKLDIAATDRAKLSRLEIAGQNSAAATYLLDDSTARPLVGLHSGETIEERQPFRSGSFYIHRALETQADVREGTIAALLDIPVNMLILNDVGAMSADTRQKVSDWIDSGGMLLSFAGPRLAQTGTVFSPVVLRPASRTMGGALTWGKPVTLAPFPPTSPFHGITIDPKVSVARQVLAEPRSDIAAYGWAYLADNTPLITAKRQGAGVSILVHTSAGPDWTDLPLSGMFEQMLRRLLPLAGRSNSVGDRAAGPFILETAIAGDGTLGAPGFVSKPVPADTFAATASGPLISPGLYKSGNQVRALNLANINGPIGPRTELEPINRWPDGISQHQEQRRSFDLAPWLWTLALLALAADGMATLVLRRRLPTFSLKKFAPAKPAAALLFFSMIIFLHATGTVRAAAPPGALDVRIGYVTGALAAPVNAEQGLQALNEALITRTAIRPGPPTGIIPGRDPLGFYTIIYWPVPATAQPLDERAALAVARYLAVGGLLIIDTARAGATPAARARAANQMLSTLSLPRLEQLSEKHVLAKSFYLLARGPSQPYLSQLWVEADTTGDDGRISGVIIGSQDMAAALVDTSRDSLRREAALRIGINAIMYALTGTYKADQVHAESLLDLMRKDDTQIRRIEP
jgi:hypothetical protein